MDSFTEDSGCPGEREELSGFHRPPAGSEHTLPREGATLLPVASLHLAATLSIPPGGLKAPAPQDFKGIWEAMKLLAQVLSRM